MPSLCLHVQSWPECIVIVQLSSPAITPAGSQCQPRIHAAHSCPCNSQAVHATLSWPCKLTAPPPLPPAPRSGRKSPSAGRTFQTPPPQTWQPRGPGATAGTSTRQRVSQQSLCGQEEQGKQAAKLATTLSWHESRANKAVPGGTGMAAESTGGEWRVVQALWVTVTATHCRAHACRSGNQAEPDATLKCAVSPRTPAWCTG